MQLKVRIKVGSIFKVPDCKAPYDIAPPEPKNLERKGRADKTQYFLGRKNQVINFVLKKNLLIPQMERFYLFMSLWLGPKNYGEWS